MTHLLSNLPEAYKNIVEKIEYELDYNVYTLTIKSIPDKISVKHNKINV